MPTGYFFDIITALQHVAEKGGPKAAVVLLDGSTVVDGRDFTAKGTLNDMPDNVVLRKRQREEHFPAELIENALKVNLEDRQASVEYAPPCLSACGCMGRCMPM